MQYLVPGLLGSLSDSKPLVRAGVVGCMDTLLEQTLLKEFFVDEMLLTAMTKGNHFTKQEVLKWLSVNLPEARSVPKEDLMAMITVLYAAVEDRNADVRKAAQDAIPAFMRHIGFQKMQSATEKLKPGSKSTLVPLLEKARETIPQPEPKKGARPGAKPAAVRGGGRPAAGSAPAQERKTSNAPTL